VSSRPRSPKIGLFGHFGSLNSGNEATLTAFLNRMHLMFPDAEFVCICTDPEAVVTREGIDAFPMTTRSGRDRGDATQLVRRMRALRAELAEFARALRTLSGTDVLIVPGTGLVTDAFGLHVWGPFTMFKWVLAARLRRARVMFVSIGAGPLYSRSGRVLVRACLALAHYRSYRDEASRDSVSATGFRASRDRVFPDLAFSLPDALLPTGIQRESDGRRVVGIGLMSYSGRYSASDPWAETHAAYLESLASLVAWLLDRDYDIRLLIGDGDGDRGVIDEFRSVLRKLRTDVEQRVVEQEPSSQDVLSELARTDLVVATRFHNVLLSLLLDKPVIAISFHHKCTELMRQMQLSEYCHDIRKIDVEALVRQLESIEQHRDEVKSTIAAGVRRARASLDEQYDLLFADR
jgi:polysaccharide pyruvyl transferase WcaK-like protein